MTRGMNNKHEQERVHLIFETCTHDAKDKLGRDVAAFTAKLAGNKGLNGSQRWVELADLLATGGRGYIDNLAEQLRGGFQSPTLPERFAEAASEFLEFAGSIYSDHWKRNRAFRVSDSPPPKHWSEMRQRLETEIRLQQLDIAGRQSSQQPDKSETELVSVQHTLEKTGPGDIPDEARWAETNRRAIRMLHLGDLDGCTTVNALAERLQAYAEATDDDQIMRRSSIAKSEWAKDFVYVIKPLVGHSPKPKPGQFSWDDSSNR